MPPVDLWNGEPLAKDSAGRGEGLTFTRRDDLGHSLFWQLDDEARAFVIDESEKFFSDAQTWPVHDRSRDDARVLDLKLIREFPKEIFGFHRFSFLGACRAPRHVTSH